MEEDVLGTMRSVSAVTYVECSRCGKMTPQQSAHIVPGSALDSHSEYEQLCPTCFAAVVQGEPELPTTEP